MTSQGPPAVSLRIVVLFLCWFWYHHCFKQSQVPKQRVCVVSIYFVPKNSQLKILYWGEFNWKNGYVVEWVDSGVKQFFVRPSELSLPSAGAGGWTGPGGCDGGQAERRDDGPAARQPLPQNTQNSRRQRQVYTSDVPKKLIFTQFMYLQDAENLWTLWPNQFPILALKTVNVNTFISIEV